MRGVAVAVVLAVLSINIATAFPDGAPWGAANPAADENCATCHFGADPVFDSPALTIAGLPDAPRPGARYDLTISFDDPEIVVAGFQLFVQMLDEQAGALSSGHPGVEFVGAALRSTEPVAGDGSARWQVEWTTPASIEWPIVFYLAASAANDDQSPFGDTIHFRTYRFGGD